MVWVDPAVDLLAYGSRRVALTSGGQVRVKEGDAVQKGELIAQLDTAELRAQHAGAKAAVQRAIAAIARAEADIAIRKAEYDLAELETQRVAHLEQTSAGTKADLDRRRAQSLVTAAQIEGSRAAQVEAKAAKEAADAQVTQIDAMLDDSELHTPVSGRVEYKLVQAGEVVAAGGRLVTILDLSDVYMTVFLPTGESGRVALGSEARIVLDTVPHAVSPRPFPSWPPKHSSRRRRSRRRTSGKS